MVIQDNTIPDRRQFLKYLATSPLLSYLGLQMSGVSAEIVARIYESDTDVYSYGNGPIITSVKDAINVFDFHRVAHDKLPPAHYGHLATGAEDDVTIRANRDGFLKFPIQARRLINVLNVDTTTEILGTKLDIPIMMAPIGSQQMFHPEAEITVGKATKAKGSAQIMSTFASMPIERIAEANGKPVWYQLYPTSEWSITRQLIKRAESAACPVLVLTVDTPAAAKRETFLRYKKRDARDCSLCHTTGQKAYAKRRPMFEHIDVSGLKSLRSPQITWDFVKRLKDVTSMKLVLKGIMSPADAQRALEHGVDGLIVSNHGGRAESSGRSTIESLPAIIKAVDEKLPVILDSGIRRGTDVFKALALGADAVCIGRPYLWGLAAFGQPGVESVLDILKSELLHIMKQSGTVSIKEISKAYIAT